MQPLVSVIVPIFNVEKYIEKCLESIRNQTYKEIEVLLINDGTKDKSGIIAEEFCKSDNRFKYYAKPNGGVSSARNYGLERASGEYIYFIDSDDWIEKNYIEELLAGFTDDVDVVIANYTLVDSVIGKTYVPFRDCTKSKVYSDEEKEDQILCRNINSYPRYGYEIKTTLMPVWKNMYRHRLLSDNNLFFVPEKSVGAEDYIFNCEAYYYARSVATISASGYYHVIVDGSLSRKYNLDEMNRVINKYKIVKEFINTHSFYSKEKALDSLENDMCKEIVIVISNFIKNSNIKEAKKIHDLLDRPDCKVIYTKQKLNIESKYVILVKILRFFSDKTAFFIISLLNKFYGLYRRLLYLSVK